jgi:predicted alpha/beta-hydrolase family hydrolase
MNVAWDVARKNFPYRRRTTQEKKKKKEERK